MLIRGRQQRAARQLEHALALRDVTPGAIMKFRSAHRMLKFLVARDLAEKRIGREQHVIIEKDVVDAHHALIAQRDVIGFGRALEHLQPDAEVGVMIKIRAGRHDPIDETIFDERDKARHAEARGRQRAGHAHADHHVALEDFLGEQAAGLAQAAAVVSEERAVDQVGGGHIAAHGLRIYLLAAEQVRPFFLLRHGVSWR